jgi:virginiamycin A acetyltransferase
MNSSLFGRVRLRVLDRALQTLERPNRIDRLAEISASAQVAGSRLYGPVRVGDHARLFRVELHGPIEIGTGTSLWGPRIYAEARPHAITFGNYCSVATDVSFHGFGHDPQRLSTHYIGRNLIGRPIEEEIVSKGPITIGHDVWIGTGVRVMSGVSIGTGAIVGAGSIVTRDIPPYAVAVGAPAVPAHYRFDQHVIERLLASEWWLWDRAKICASADLFTQQISDALLDRYL